LNKIRYNPHRLKIIDFELPEIRVKGEFVFNPGIVITLLEKGSLVLGSFIQSNDLACVEVHCYLIDKKEEK